jgi:hypothetical protein
MANNRRTEIRDEGGSSRCAVDTENRLVKPSLTGVENGWRKESLKLGKIKDRGLMVPELRPLH